MHAKVTFASVILCWKHGYSLIWKAFIYSELSVIPEAPARMLTLVECNGDSYVSPRESAMQNQLSGACQF